MTEDIDTCDILGSCGMAGDDADEFLQGFADDYGIDFSAFLEYLHFNGNEPPLIETAWGVGGDGKRMAYIPIALDDLVAAARSKTWKMAYPEHRIVERSPFRFVIYIALISLAIIAFFEFFPPQ